jgi:imidazolonepropionase-like amidohydrolase
MRTIMHCPTTARGFFGAALLIGLSAAPLAAQLGDFNPRPEPHGVYAIRNVKIYPVSGPVIDKGNVVIGMDGRIQAVGATAVIPSGAKTIDGTGLTVYPGMMETSTTLGLNEIPDGVVQTNDASEIGSFNPNVHAFFGLNSHSAHIGVTRVVGVTNVVSRPMGGVISGQATLINLAGDTPPQMTVVRDVAMVINLPGGGSGRGRGGRGGQPDPAVTPVAGHTPLDSLKTLLRDAEAYGNAQDAYAKDKTLPRPPRDVVLEALVPVARGAMPVIMPAETATEIRDAVTFAEQNHFKPIIIGGRQALQVADFLKQHNVPVIITGVLSLPPGEDDPYDINYSLPGKLAAAGVRFAVSSGAEQGSERNLPYVAGMAAAFGLSKDDAVKAITLWPAQIFGVGDKLGSIEVGKMANLVVTTGDLLEAKTDTKALFINGQPIPLSSKHTYMFELFKDRP